MKDKNSRISRFWTTISILSYITLIIYCYGILFDNSK